MLQSFDHGKHSHKSSTTLFKWWSFLLLVSLLLVMIQLSGCSATVDPGCSIPQGPANLVIDDAVSLIEFQQLSGSLKSARRARADLFLEQAKKSKRSDVLIIALTNASGLAPDNQETWLKLANIWRWVGDYFKVESCLENALAALSYLDDDKGLSTEDIFSIKKKTILEHDLLRSWLHYDRGEWDKGLRWANKAAGIEKGSTSVRQIQGLLAACSGKTASALDIVDDIRWADFTNTDSTWVLAALDRTRNKWGAAFSSIGGIQPTGSHVAECYREMGVVAEYLGHWHEGRRWYAQSGAALPMDNQICLSKRSAQRLDTGDEKILMPVWLAFDRYFVTGSRSSYASLAWAKFESASSSDEKEFWGGQVVNTAGILIRWDIDKSYAYRARGLVFLAMGKAKWGMSDLRRASAIFAAQGRKDSRIEGALGHALLLEKKPQRALVHLRSSIDLDPSAAKVWSDLGMSLVQVGKSQEAERALTMAVGLDASLATAWYNRGLIYVHRKDWELAEMDLIKAAELAPDNQDVAALLQKLKQRKNQ